MCHGPSPSFHGAAIGQVSLCLGTFHLRLAWMFYRVCQSLIYVTSACHRVVCRLCFLLRCWHRPSGTTLNTQPRRHVCNIHDEPVEDGYANATYGWANMQIPRVSQESPNEISRACMDFVQHLFTCWIVGNDWSICQSISSAPVLSLSTGRLCCNTVIYQNICVCLMHANSNTRLPAIVASAITQCLMVTPMNYRIPLQVQIFSAVLHATLVLVNIATCAWHGICS